MTLVAAAIVSVGLTELYFTYQDSKRTLSGFERDKASTAGAVIEQQIEEILREIEAVAQPTVDNGRAGLAERKQDFLSLQERDDSFSQLSYLDSGGKERVRTSPWSSTEPTRGSISPGV